MDGWRGLLSQISFLCFFCFQAIHFSHPLVHFTINCVKFSAMLGSWLLFFHFIVCPCCSLENCNAWYNCTTLATTTPFQFHTPLNHSERCTGMKSSSQSGQTEIDGVLCAMSNVLWDPPQRDERLFLVSAADIKVYFQSSMGQLLWNGSRLRDVIRFSRSISCWPTDIGVFLITV